VNPLGRFSPIPILFRVVGEELYLQVLRSNRLPSFKTCSYFSVTFMECEPAIPAG